SALAIRTQQETIWEEQTTPWSLAQMALAEYISGLMAPWVRQQKGEHAEYHIIFARGNPITIARGGNGRIVINIESAEVRRWLAWAADPSAFSPDESYEIASNIVEAIIHETTHAYEESSHEETHNDLFYERMMNILLQLAALRVSPVPSGLGGADGSVHRSA